MTTNHHRRGPWSESEDAYLMSLVNSQGALNWVRIASTLGSRTPKQCRERFHQNLKPTLNHDPITPEEGVIIERLVRELGKRWAEIARRLNGRSDNAVKNWWNGSQNRRKRSEKRKALAMPFDDRQEIQPRFPHHHPNISTPRTLPMPSLSRPMPAPLLSASLHNERYGATVETPLSSPLSNSPGSELAPSLMSDSGSYYSTSPASRVELPPLKMPSDGMPHYSPRSSVSPSDTKLPPFSQLVHYEPPPPYSASPVASSPAYPTSPEMMAKAESGQRYFGSSSSSSRGDYFSAAANSHYPTAPNSPVMPSPLHQLQSPIGRSGGQQPQRDRPRDERVTRVNVSDLVHH